MTVTVQENAKICLNTIKFCPNFDTAPGLLNIAKEVSYHSCNIGWEQSFLETGNIGRRSDNGRPEKSEEFIHKAEVLFQNDSILSVCAASSRSQLPPPTVHCIFCKCRFCFPTIFKIFKH